MAARYAVSPARVALAWLLTRPALVAPIASATSTEQLKDLLKCTELRLDAESLELLSQGRKPIGV